jgi:hypothetical protein
LNRRTFYLVTTLWACAILACFAAVERHANQPAAVPPPGITWPVDSAIEPAPGQATALIFAHPKCPCTQASIQQFQRIEARHPGAFSTIVLFTIPESDQEDWTSTRLVQQAGNLRSARVVFDPGGREASRFRAAVSGQVLLFSKTGRLLYSGGVTAARGHEGDNAGQDAFEHALAHPDDPAAHFPIYGCGLITQVEPESQGEDRASA